MKPLAPITNPPIRPMITLLAVIVSVVALLQARQIRQARQGSMDSTRLHHLARTLEETGRDAARLQSEWESRKSAIQTARAQISLSSVLLSSPEGRIDFKVSLYEARLRLGQMARENNVTLPADLGIPEAIGADEDTETRLGQLAATVLLLEDSISRRIPVIESVLALPPLIRQVEVDEFTHQVTYPVLIRMRCRYPELLRLLEAHHKPNPIFSLERFHVMGMLQDEPEWLEIQTKWNVILFATAGARGSAQRQPPSSPLPARSGL